MPACSPRVPGHYACLLSPLWHRAALGDREQGTSEVTPSTGTTPRAVQVAQKKAVAPYSPSGHKPRPAARSREWARSGPAADTTTSGHQPQPGVVWEVLQWLITAVPSRGHCDIKERQSARRARGLQPLQQPRLSLEHLPYLQAEVSL